MNNDARPPRFALDLFSGTGSATAGLRSRGRVSLPVPYYEDSHVKIFHGDCREILPGLEGAETCVTDPVWPNAHPDLVGACDPLQPWNECLAVLPDSVKRLVVWLGCQSDPRFLCGVPTRLPFLRAQYLRRAVPSYNGRCLVSGDVAFAFGAWPMSREGARVIPGECGNVTSNPSRRQDHPAARNEDHAKWLLRWWGQGTVLDPFVGTGTTLVAAKHHNLHAIGIEVEEKYCEIAALRCSQGVLDLGSV